MEIRFLFWNLKARPLEGLVATLATEHQSDVVALVECQIEPATLITTLRAGGSPGFTYPFTSAQTGDIRIFARLPASALRTVYDDENNHLTVRRLAVRGQREILLVVSHFQSKIAWSEEDQASVVGRLARRIEKFERKYKHARTVLVGDLNMNPFEKGMVGSEGLHAVMTKRIAERGGRTVDAEHRPFFYNPMWGLFGDRSAAPAGTYYSRSSRPHSYFWHMYDQVLVRPDLMHALRDVKILDRAGDTSLLGEDGTPDDGVGSDHLPISFVVDL